MAELSWNETTPLSRIHSAGRHGATEGDAGLSMAELTGFELVQVMARRGQWSAVAEACRDAYGEAPPATPQAIAARDAMLVWSGPDQFLVLAPRGTVAERAGAVFSGLASLSEQSDGRSAIRIAGSRARAMLAKVSSLDLHPAMFPAGTAAATAIDHTSVNLWRGTDGADGEAIFYMLVFATFAESLWHTLLDSGAEYGIAIDAPRAWQP